jgi:DNA-binding GntR family transcriptional regulator
MSSAPLSRVERVYLDIRGRIVGGEYAPGAPLSEAALTRIVRTSRTPIREALCRLREEGYVEQVPGRGFHVSRITVRLVQDTFEVRRLLEGTAAARAAEVSSPAAVLRLRQLAPVPYVVGDAASAKRAEQANTQFHLAVAEAGGNALLVDLVRHCLDQVARFMAHGAKLPNLQARASQEHQEIVDAVERHDPAAARDAMERHLDDCSRQFMHTLVRGGLRDVAV